MRNIVIVIGALVVGGIAAFFVWQHNQSATSSGTAMQATAPAQPAATAGTTSGTSTSGTSTSGSAPSGTTAGSTAASGSNGQQTADASQPALYPDDMYLGRADAKITVIEYASLSCPHCARFNSDVLPQIKANYIDKGLVRWVYRDYPLNRPAYQAAVLTHCTSPLRYFGLVDQLFKSQDFWATQQDALPQLHQIGITDGVTAEAFDACLKDQALQDKILSRLKDADARYKVDATPSFIVQGELHSGEISYDDFKALLDKALGHS